MIQLLYGNNGVNYTEIARSSNLSEEQYSELYKSYLGYPFTVSPELYEKKEEEPIAYNMLVTNLFGKLPKDMLMLSKKAKMCSYETPCYYAHLQLLDIEEEMLKMDFPGLFKYDFIDESEIPGYHNGLIEGDGKEKEYFINDKALRVDQIKASLYLLYRYIDSWTKKVTIIIDTDGPGYNQRALDIVAGIYKHIPWSLRKLVGFTTYSTPDVKEPRQIKIRIMPHRCLEACDEEEVLDFRKKDLLDSVAVRSVPERIKRFVDKLWEENEKENWFGLLWENFKDSGNLAEHLDYFERIEVWSKGDIKEHFKKIMEYALDKDNQGKAEYQKFKNDIESRIKQKIYDEIILEDLNTVQEADEFFMKYKRYDLFAKVFAGRKLNAKCAVEWFEKNFLHSILKEQDLQKKFNKFMQLSKRLEGKELKFISKDIRVKWKNMILEYAKKLNNDMKKEKKKEQEEICVFINSLHECFYITDVKERYKRIRYKDDNKNYFQRRLYYFLRENILENNMSFQEENFLKSQQWVKECKEIIESNDYELLNRLLGEIRKERKNREELLFIMWNTRDDIKKYYENRTKIHMLYGTGRDTAEEDMKYFLIINGKKFLLKEWQMDDITDYLLNDTEENLERAKRVFHSEKNLVEELEGNGFLHPKKKAFYKLFRSRRKR
jgi:hypothetical protein